jgi:hypothetical protein
MANEVQFHLDAQKAKEKPKKILNNINELIIKKIKYIRT